MKLSSDATEILMRNFLKSFESQSVLSSFETDEEIGWFKKFINKVTGKKTKREKEMIKLFSDNSGTIRIIRPHQYKSERC